MQLWNRFRSPAVRGIAFFVAVVVMTQLIESQWGFNVAMLMLSLVVVGLTVAYPSWNAALIMAAVFVMTINVSSMLPPAIVPYARWLPTVLMLAAIVAGHIERRKAS